jgi:hypothetical protein
MFTVFRQVHRLSRPTELSIQSFCDSIFLDVDDNPDLDGHVTEIHHYKEKVLPFSCVI